MRGSEAREARCERCGLLVWPASVSESCGMGGGSGTAGTGWEGCVLASEVSVMPARRWSVSILLAGGRGAGDGVGGLH